MIYDKTINKFGENTLICMNNQNHSVLLNDIDFNVYKIINSQLRSCTNNCYNQSVIENFLKNIMFELRVIQEQIDYSKYK